MPGPKRDPDESSEEEEEEEVSSPASAPRLLLARQAPLRLDLEPDLTHPQLSELRRVTVRTYKGATLIDFREVSHSFSSSRPNPDGL